MKRSLLFLLLLCIFTASRGQQLNYYLPDSIRYDASVPKPKDIIHHEVGEWHVTHDRLVQYMHAVAKAVPSRVQLQTMGYTYEGRPQVLLVITSPSNHQRLEEIRKQHLQLSDPAVSSSVNIDKMPAVVWIGHSIHGNEPSGSNASLLTAYYLAAGQGKKIDDILENLVILFDPSFNPDGLQRFSTWVNQHRGKNLVSDPNSREFNEVWPGGRFNHYWFDLNRDWLPAVHVESQNRLKIYHQWKPNVLTDHHEQGSSATFFFQPGVPSRVNPLTPAKNQELTAKMGNYHAAYLDKIGSLYFTKENYDDFYYGKGSTYPDINGSIGILFEQASSRGHLQKTANGLLSFPFTIRNQFVTALSTMEAAKDMRQELLQFQRDFYRNSLNEVASLPVKAYVFGDANDKGKTATFITMLRRHMIDVYQLGNDVAVGGKTFTKDANYIVPLAQAQNKVIRAIFEKTLTYKDSLFYDITSWTMPLAFGLPYGELSARDYNAKLLGEKLAGDIETKGVITGRSNYAYVIDWNEFSAPAVLYELQSKGIGTRVATNIFSATINGVNKKFNYGSILVPLQVQNISADALYQALNEVTKKYAVNIYALTTGASAAGIDLGSSRFVALDKPVIATLTGPGVTPMDAGEFWHLMDQRFNIPVSHLDINIFNRVDISKYNTIVLVGGTYNDINKEKLKAWVQSGGVLILMEEAVSWASQNGINGVNLKPSSAVLDSTQRYSFVDREQVEGAQNLRGAIFRAELDLTHPLAYGYNEPYVHLFKSNKVFMQAAKNPFNTPVYYKDKPLVSGWASRQNIESVKNSAAIVVVRQGSGRVISISDNPIFRAFWLGGSKLLMNAIFFGKLTEQASSAPTD